MRLVLSWCYKRTSGFQEVNMAMLINSIGMDVAAHIIIVILQFKYSKEIHGSKSERKYA